MRNTTFIFIKMILNQSKNASNNINFLPAIAICILIFYSLSGDHAIRYSGAWVGKLDSKTYKRDNNLTKHNRTMILIWYLGPVHA